jgi:exopolyphosphatase/guanosine-5'-triphosphate,3'-diphosphate pyrophosphatase
LDHVPENSRFASLDIGSHTIRLLIAQVEGRKKVLPIKVERRITQLARNFSDGETLKEDSIQESITGLREFAALLHQYGAQSVNCGATGVIRRARNAADFLRKVHDATGIYPTILSEEAEALLSAKGILSGLRRAERFVLSFDLGGSTTELLLIDTCRTESLWNTSVFVGAATITEWHLPGDPPERRSVTHAVEAIREAFHQTLLRLRALLKRLDVPLHAVQMVGTAGTVTTLAAMLLKMAVHEPSRVNGLVLTEEWLTKLIDRLSALPLVERQQLVGLERGRERIILGGALIVRELLRGLEHAHFTVVDSGLLEGLVLTLIEKEYGWPTSLASPLTFQL